MIQKVSVPEGTKGQWRIERVTIGADEARIQSMMAVFKGGRGVFRSGQYTRLMRGRQLVMSDTPDEMRDHMQFVRMARGRVLINGLGLGMVLGAVLAKPEVECVTVVEGSQDVFDLVAPHYVDKRLEIIVADAFEYRPPKGIRYDCVWHDIWDDLCTDNLEGMTRLKRKYGRRAEWQGCWGEGIIRAKVKREKRGSYDRFRTLGA